MPLDPNYVPLTPLWEVFTDKDLLTFLSDGYVKFYVDTARTVGKPVYQLTGSPPNYTYTQYGFMDTDGSWRVNMNLQGAFDKVIYGYPLDNSGNVELYFAQFFNSDGVFQFSREGFPNFFSEGGNVTTPVNINFIPNGQFRLHTDLPAIPTLNLQVGQVRSPITQIAFGGWTFERPIASTARDFVLFDRIGSYVTNPEKSPRYAVRIISESPNIGDTFKDLRIEFDDVNKFASNTNQYTFSISSKLVSGSTLNVDLVLIKNFGTLGDSTIETILTTFTITNTFSIYYFPFVFGENSGNIIGPFDDDYLQLAIRLPPNSLFDIEFTDAVLTPGNVISPSFNDTTTREFMYESLFDDKDVPNSDGSSIGLPLILTKNGIRFDNSQVGCILPYSAYTAPYGFLLCDGSGYDSTQYSSDGIPYFRLRDILLSSNTSPLTYTVPIFGTGQNFLTAFIDANLDIQVSTNIAGTTAVPSDGANPTGFQFSNVHTGQTNILSTAYASNGQIYIISNVIGTSNAPNMTTISGGTSQNIINGAGARNVSSLSFTVGAPGQYFTFTTPFAAQLYLVWYKINGVGTMPSVPFSIPIGIDIYSGVSAQDIMNITANAISGKQNSSIRTVAAASIPANAYFYISTLSQNYYVWYNINNSGTDPNIIGKIGIEVKILSTDTKNQVTSKTASALNSRFFAVPDLRGLFIKGNSDGSTFDLRSSFRYSANSSATYGNLIGTREYSNNISTFDGLAFGAGTGNFIRTTSGAADLNTPRWSSESRPENLSLNYIIKY